MNVLVSGVHAMLRHAYTYRYNKQTVNKLVLHEPESQTTALLVATVWIARTPSDAVCGHKHNTVQSYQLAT
jgi:hypothetical protein